MYITGSYSFFKDDIVEYLKSIFPKGATGLDMGCGSGKYGFLLDNYFLLDGVEACADVVYNETLDYYDRLFHADIREFQFHIYDFIILGDVLEHLTVEEAKKLLEYIYPKCKEIIVAVPFEYVQDAIDGNLYEIHKQDDLTPELMAERYPELKVRWINDVYGVYTK